MNTNLTFNEILIEAAREAAQAKYNELVKPYFIKRMRVLGVVKFNQVMGVNLFTMKDGRTLADSEFSDLSPAKAAFSAAIDAALSNEIYTLVDGDIDITNHY